MEIRITKGVGSNPKLWGMLYAGSYARQIMELDVPNAYTPLTAIIWGRRERMNGMDLARNTREPEPYVLTWPSPYGDLAMLNRRLYLSVEEVVAALEALWPEAEIVRADDERLGRL